MSRQDHKDYDAALEKIRREAQAVMVPQRERRRKRDRALTIILAIGTLGLTLVGIIWAAICGFVCLFFLADWIANTEGAANWEKKKIRLVQVCTIVSGTAIGAWPVHHQYGIEKAEAHDGKLVAHDTFQGIPPNKYVIEFGTGMRFLPDKTNHVPWVNLTDKLRFDWEGDRILFSTAVRDRSGNLIVKIDRNIWNVSDQKSISWDKNYNYAGDCLEVQDGRGRVVLQVKLFTNGVELVGEWYDELSGSARLGGSGLKTLNDPHFHDNEAIAPVFKYPSREHWGEFIK